MSLSIYIHWPFCLSKCPYCDFNSHVLTGTYDYSKWTYAYKTSINHFADKIIGQSIKSIYFGGGTPSLMDPLIVESIIDQISNMATISSDTEITLETNPTSFEIEKFNNFKAAGINRISIGVQSLRETDLQNLGRAHDVKSAVNTIQAAAKIFPKYSFDLIYARSGQTLNDWKDELSEAADMAGGHISLYQLTIEKGTQFYKLFHSGQLVLPDNDVAADMYEWTNEFMDFKGYNRYEISNFAMAENECKHNLTYWHYNNYIGIGPGAHSRIIDHGADASQRVKRIMMFYRPEQWLSSVYEPSHGIQLDKCLSTAEIVREKIMMGLRLKDGISIKAVEKLTTLQIFDVLNIENLQQYMDMGLLTCIDDKICLTDKGLILHNYLVPRLIKI